MSTVKKVPEKSSRRRPAPHKKTAPVTDKCGFKKVRDELFLIRPAYRPGRNFFPRSSCRYVLFGNSARLFPLPRVDLFYGRIRYGLIIPDSASDGLRRDRGKHLEKERENGQDDNDLKNDDEQVGMEKIAHIKIIFLRPAVRRPRLYRRPDCA